MELVETCHLLSVQAIRQQSGGVLSCVDNADGFWFFFGGGGGKLGEDANVILKSSLMVMSFPCQG